MKKSVLALIAIFILAGFAGMAEAQRGGGGGGHGGMSGGHAGGGGWSGGGTGGGGWHGGGTGGGGWHGGGTGGSWHGGGGWHGGSGWHGGGWHGGWRGGCWGCGSGWWWGGVGLGVAIAAPWWGYPYWGGYYGWGAPYYYDSTYYGTGYTGYYGSDPVYMQQQPAAPTYAPAPSAPPVTWFYCTDPAGYYPYVQSCSRPWMRVVPDATQPSPAPSYQPQQG